MDWIPVVLVTFKLVVLAIGMFYAVKWHYDRGRRGKEGQPHTVLRASGMVAALFTASLLGLGFITFSLGAMLGLDMTFP